VNAGVIRTFEEAIRSATGDIIFLCDDDDLWAPDKVRKVLQIFAADPDTRIVATGLSLIDENDQPIPGSDFMRHRNFSSNFFANLLHNQFQGSAMAFRSSLLRDVLPLPSNHLFLHDVWIGTRNTLAGGKAIFLDEPLLLYRRHAGNYSRKMGFLKQLRLRMQLVSTHLARWFQRL
jgi:glycosyltransferase involved in cell wall biosynthesis